jgi:hypothetical protein
MADMDTALKEAMQIDGAVAVAVVDYASGMALGTLGGGHEFDIGVAAAGNTEVVRAKIRTLDLLKLNDSIEDILITLQHQYHIIRPLTGRTGHGLFLYLALIKARANLAMARHRLRTIEQELLV